MSTSSLSSVSTFYQPSYPKPNTRWNVLDLVEPQSQKIYRRFGQLFVGVGFAAAAGRYVAARRLSFTLAIVAVGSLVSGAVLWFFNRSNFASQRLLKDRKQVGEQIETCALLELRKQFTHPLVFSDKELNEWIRYFAGKDPFETFMQKQTERVFSLPLEPETLFEPETLWFLRHKVFEYFQQSNVQITFKAFRAHPLHSRLRPDQCDNLYKVIAGREASKVGVDAASYAKFIQEQGVEVLNHLDEEQLQRLQPGFAAQVLRSEIGIIELQAKHAEELRAFGYEARTLLQAAIANREATNLPYYSTFVKRNGLDAVPVVTDITAKERLSESFISQVVSRDIGLAQIGGREMSMFGWEVHKRIERAVLDREMAALTSGTMTYKQFRERNGLELIESRTPTERETQFRPHFLKLPYADLVNPLFSEDRKLLNITPKDIQDTLRARWSGMTLKEVLATDQGGFLASMEGESPYFTPQEWTAKAVVEIQKLSDEEIKTLIQAKVCCWMDLIDAH